VANRWRCPLTGLAARYTANRRDNFETSTCRCGWHGPTKQVFGTLFVAGGLVTLWVW
jgi:hypothetical protein